MREALASPRLRVAEQRARAAGEVFYHPGGATGRALQLVYELIDAAARRCSTRGRRRAPAPPMTAQPPGVDETT